MTTRALPLLLALLALLPAGTARTDVEYYWVGGGTSGWDVPDPGDVGACLEEIDESLDGCIHQTDGGQPGDASDHCSAPSPDVLPGTTFQGILLPPIDLEDNYGLVVPTNSVSYTISITSAIAPHPVGNPRAQHAVTVYAPSGSTLCATELGTATPGEPFTFSASTTGKFTLRVRPAIDDVPVPLPPSTRSCHYMCDVTNATNYVITVAGG